MEWPQYYLPPPPVLTPFHHESLGFAFRGGNDSNSTPFAKSSATWPQANAGYFYPFRIYVPATALQLLFFVAATSSGNIDMAIYDKEKNRIVSAGSTAMSATVNTVQELNIADTLLNPGEYLLGVACDNTTGTTFYASINDELTFCNHPVYEQTGLTGPTLPNPCVPVLCTLASPPVIFCGIQFATTF